MKKSKRRNNGYSMIIKLVAIVFCLVTVTFSWFIFSKEGWINPFEVNVTDVINVVISKDGVNWTDKLVVSESSDDYGSFTEFSGNGDKLYIPIISNKKITGYYRPDYSNREHKDYVEIQTYVKTDGKIKFYLDPTSTILPSDENRFEDNIAGSVRVAFLIENYAPVIWAPNSTYHYNKNTGEFTKNGAVESKYEYIYKDSDDQFIDLNESVEIPTNEQVAGYSKENNFMWGDLSLINDYINTVEPIFIANGSSQNEITIPMTIRVWVEGTDREAERQFIGGKVKMNLKFKTERA